jgi:hypothetical protein
MIASSVRLAAVQNWFAEELRQRDPKVALPHYVSEIVMAAETARENERIVPDEG